MFMRNWPPWARRRFWWLVCALVPILIALISAIGTWMNVPEFRRMVGLDRPPGKSSASTTAKATASSTSRSSNRTAETKADKSSRNDAVGESAGRVVSEDKTPPPPEGADLGTVQTNQAESASLNGTAFSIDSMEDTSFGIGAQIQGEYSVRPNTIEVVLPKSLLKLHSRAYHSGPRRLNFISVGVGTFNCAEPWRSEIVSSKQVFRVGKVMNPGESINFEQLRFSIPKKDLGDLSNRQLIIQIDNEAIATGANGNKTRAYAYTAANIFRRAY